MPRPLKKTTSIRYYLSADNKAYLEYTADLMDISVSEFIDKAVGGYVRSLDMEHLAQIKRARVADLDAPHPDDPLYR